ncbi:MAG: hypothetical protein AB1649_11220 [Chloroflexota bacterium]
MKRRERNYFDVKIKIAMTLFFVNALLWVGFSIMLFLEMSRLNTGIPPAISAFFLLGIAGLLVAAGILVAKKIPWAYYFAVVILAANIVLNFAGALGPLAFVSILLDILILMLLISSQRPYFHKA